MEDEPCTSSSISNNTAVYEQAMDVDMPTAMTPADLTSLESVCSSMSDCSPHNDDDWPECDSLVVLHALNEAYSELVANMIYKVERALETNRKRQKEVLLKQQAFRESEISVRKKVPVLQYLPPYFKDEHMMCPPLSDEARRKLQSTTFDPLIKEEKKWTSADILTLKAAVHQSMLQNRIQPILDRREILMDKIKCSGQETTELEMSVWKEELETINNKIMFEKNIPQKDLFVGDYSKVDWAKISNIDFMGSRTPASIRLKWLNEQCPRWNKEPWSKEELARLKELRETRFISWPVVADRLGTRRTPWQCFEKYKSELQQTSKDWTQEEDEKLIALVNMMKINGKIQWDKVTYYMPGRQRQQVRTRYMRTLDKTVKHGKWTDQEDLLLMCAVNRVGAKDWSKVCKAVPGRTDVQCRDRWTTALDRRISNKEWTLEEDEKLLYAICVLGRGNWAKCASLLSGRTGPQCKYRYQTLVCTKIRLCTAQTSHMNIGIRLLRNSYHTRMMKTTRVDRLYRRFNDLVNGEDPSGEALIQQVAELSAVGAHPSTNNGKNPLTEEEEQTIIQGFNDISNRYKQGIQPDLSSLISSIPLDEADVAEVVAKGHHITVYGRARSKFLRRVFPNQNIRRPVVPKIKATQYLLADSVTERTEFTDDVPESERVMCMTEALCQAVRKYDQHQWNIDFRKDEQAAAMPVVEHFVTEQMECSSAEAANCMIEGSTIPADCSLPPCFSTINAFSTCEFVRPSLYKQAVNLFNMSDVGISDPRFRQAPDTGKKYEPTDRMNIQLTDDVTKGDEYLALKARLRCVLLEPARLHVACETAEEEANRLKVNQQLVERAMEEQSLHDGTTQMTGDVDTTAPSDVIDVVGDGIEMGEVNSQLEEQLQANGDDVIDNVIDDVVQRVCHTGEAKKKKSKPSPSSKTAEKRPRGLKDKKSLTAGDGFVDVPAVVAATSTPQPAVTTEVDGTAEADMKPSKKKAKTMKKEVRTPEMQPKATVTRSGRRSVVPIPKPLDSGKRKSK